MFLGVKLKNAFATEIYEKLKLALLKLAKAGEKGCKVTYIGIDEDIISELITKLEKDDIDYFQEKNDYIIWNTAAVKYSTTNPPDPCLLCKQEKNLFDKFVCMMCLKHLRWESNLPLNDIATYEVSTNVTISIKDYKIDISISAI